MKNKLIFKDFALAPYQPIWEAMRTFTMQRTPETIDQIWFGEHLPVFTQGQAGKPEHLLSAGNIPVIQSDRGGQITYHGPGQLVIYVLIDLKRKQLTIRPFVTALENAIIMLLADAKIPAVSEAKAPGVYVNNAKIASLGLRIRKGCSYHGLSLNVNMDLTPFSAINPCGEPERKIIQMRDFQPRVTITDIQEKLIQFLSQTLNYTTMIRETLKELA